MTTICDLLVGLLVMPLAALNHIFGPDQWHMGPFLCDFFTTMDVLLCSASILNFLLISMDRYLIIKHPFKYARKRKFRLMFFVCLIAWIISALISLAPAIGWQMASSNLPVCIVNQSLSYQVFATLLAFYIPLAIVLTIYAHIYCATRDIFQQTGSEADDNYGRGGIDQSNSGNGKQTDIRFRRRYRRRTSATASIQEKFKYQNTSNQTRRKHPSLDFIQRRNRKSSDNENTSSNHTLTPHTRLKQVKQTLTSSRLSINSNGLSNLPRRLSKAPRRSTGTIEASRRRQSSIGNSQKAIRTLGVILGCFCVCWIPFFVFALFKPVYFTVRNRRGSSIAIHNHPVVSALKSNQSKKEDDSNMNGIPAWIDPFLLWLGYLNSMLNPLIYAVHNAEFYQAFRYLMVFKCRHINRRIQKDMYARQFVIAVGN